MTLQIDQLLCFLHASAPKTKEDFVGKMRAQGSNVSVEQTTMKSFGSLTYASVPSLGFSLQYEPSEKENETGATCQALDLYNKEAVDGWSAFEGLPLTFSWQLTGQTSTSLEHSFTLAQQTTGTDFVQAFGEPSRKGGGEPLKGGGASTLGPGAWMEWKSLRIEGQTVDLMVELAGVHARTPDRWEKEMGGRSVWATFTVSAALATASK